MSSERDPHSGRLRHARIVLPPLAVFACGFAAAYGVGASAFDAVTFAFALVGALAGVWALIRLEARGRRDDRLARDLGELTAAQSRMLADAAERRPRLRVLLLADNRGHERARIVRQRPRPLDIEQTVAFERSLALRTLPSAKTPLTGSLEAYRKPTERDREAFRDRVEEYADTLREALTRFDAYRTDSALLVRGRFRFENSGRRSAHNVAVKAHFPDPFEAVTERLERPPLPLRPTFRGKRTALATLLGADQRRGAPGPTIPSRDPPSAASIGGVSNPTYGPGSALVEIGVESLPSSSPVDMDDEAGWVLRLSEPGTYRIRWDATCDELAGPERGELELEVVDLFDHAPIRSIDELLADLDAREA